MDEEKLMDEEEEKGLNLGEMPTSSTVDAPVEEGHREELVELSDIKLLEDMNKDQLQEYAITRLGTDLKLSERVKLLRTKVMHMIRDKLKAGEEQESPASTSVTNDKSGPARASNQPEFIFNPLNRRVFEWTEALGARIDYIPCWLVDIKGNRL